MSMNPQISIHPKEKHQIAGGLKIVTTKKKLNNDLYLSSPSLTHTCSLFFPLAVHTHIHIVIHNFSFSYTLFSFPLHTYSLSYMHYLFLSHILSGICYYIHILSLLSLSHIHTHYFLTLC